MTLLSRLQALLHEGRLKILRDFDKAETLVRNYKISVWNSPPPIT